MNLRVSIVVPIYNQERHLHSSLPSILEQSYKNIEIVLVNDGSKDCSSQIIEEYRKKDSRIVVINKENGGLVDATIAGVRNATGDYVCFVDPDDRIGKDFVKTFVSSIEDDKDFIAAGLYFDNGEEIIEYQLEETRTLNEEDIIELKKDYFFNRETTDISNKIFVSRCNKMYSMSCVSKVIVEFEKCKAVSLGEDTIFTYLMLKNSKKGMVLKEANSYYYYIANQDSMTKEKQILKYLEKCKVTYEHFNNVLENNKEENDLAKELYYSSSTKAFNLMFSDKDEFVLAYNFLKRDKEYKKVLKHIAKKTNNKKFKIDMYIRYVIDSGNIYYGLRKLIFNLKNFKVGGK